MDFLSVCYHYVRKPDNSFPRILGTKIEDFEEDIIMLKNRFRMISQDDVLKSYYEGNKEDSSQKGMLITFDDGLSDHFEAAKILYENDIKGIFFVPTCIISDHLPANPTIIHYGIAEFGIEKFLEVFHEALANNRLNEEKYFLSFQKGKDDPWEIIKKIKLMFKYNLENSISRKILLYIYKNLILKKYPNALEIMHLTEENIRKMIEMGHHIGVHTHSHISVGPSKLSDEEKKTELEMPKRILEQKFNTKIESFSYPFGETVDCVNLDELPDELRQYKIIFTVEEKLNSIKTSPLELGRYQPHSTDTTDSLIKKLENIMRKKL